MILVQWTMHRLQSRLSQCHLGVQTLPLYFWYWGSTSEFLRWQRSINDAKWTFLPLFLASSITSFFVSDFRQLPCQDFLQFSHSFSTAAVASGIFFAWSIGMNLWTRLDLVNSFLLQRCDLRDTCRYTFQSFSHRFVGIDNTSTFGLAFPILRQVFPRQFTGVLRGIAAGIGISNFLRAFLMVLLHSSSSGSMK